MNDDHNGNTGEVLFSPDDWVTLRKAANMCPGRPAVNTVRKWALYGVTSPRTGEHVKLKSILCGGRVYVHVDDLREFHRLVNGWHE